MKKCICNFFYPQEKKEREKKFTVQNRETSIVPMYDNDFPVVFALTMPSKKILQHLLYYKYMVLTEYLLQVWFLACFRWSPLSLENTFTEITRTSGNYSTGNRKIATPKQYIGDKNEIGNFPYFPLVVSKPDALELASC